MPKTKKLKLSTYQRKKGSVVKTEVNAPKDKEQVRRVHRAAFEGLLESCRYVCKSSAMCPRQRPTV
jgi:hypothetical protein